MNKQRLITQLQSQGLRLTRGSAASEPTDSQPENQPIELGAKGRKGGAGPSDHKAITLDGTTVMVPVFNASAGTSPFSTQAHETDNSATLYEQDVAIGRIEFPRSPQFYSLSTADGTPYWKIALLHSHDVLATTVLQTCMRYRDTTTACQFCAIEKSLDAGLTIARKTPEQLAEVAEAAVRLDGIKHMIMTTGTPNTPDRGAAYLSECAKAIKARVNLPIQAQCEPPADFVWFERMKAAGIDSLGMHLEAITPEVRSQIMPGKAEISVERYFQAFAAAVEVFGWGQVSTYLLAGLGDTLETLVESSCQLIALGVYPFVVPFVPISNTPLAHHQPPDSDWMFELYQQIGSLLKAANMSPDTIKAGCAKCGACSALSTFATA
jgi:radical SAM protein (TIGR04043 family)